MTRPYNWIGEMIWQWRGWKRKCDWIQYHHFDEGSLTGDIRSERCKEEGTFAHDGDFFCLNHYIQNNPPKNPPIVQSEPVLLEPIITLVIRKKRSLSL